MVDILVVDDKADIRDLITETLREEFGCKVASAHNIQSAMEQLQTSPKVAILDIWLEGSHMDGIGLLKIIKSKYPNCQVLMISGHGNIDIAIKTVKLGAYDFIEKPFKTAKLLIMVERALEKYRLLEENSAFKTESSNLQIIGVSKQINKIQGIIDAVAAKNNSRVIITGEQGAGKATIANIIHNKSGRCQQPFVNWQIMHKKPQVLLDELYGRNGVRSVFERADKGTLFINEFLALPLSVQSQLLYVLQSGRLSDDQAEITLFNVRVIAATSGDVNQAIADNALSDSLYYSLNIARIDLPPLCSRREDIMPLAEHFAFEYAKDNGMQIKEFSEPVRDALLMYNWPGNVRQLKNTVEWMMIVSDDVQFKIEHLPIDLVGAARTKHVNDKADSHLFAKPIKEARELFEKEYIDAQLQKFDGNIAKTADFIGMDRSALHRKIKQLHHNS